MDKKRIDELIEQYVPFDEPIPYMTKAKEKIYIYPVLLKNIKAIPDATPKQVKVSPLCPNVCPSSVRAKN